MNFHIVIMSFSALPLEIQAKILIFVHDYNYRVVCHQWNDILSSRESSAAIGIDFVSCKSLLFRNSKLSIFAHKLVGYTFGRWPYREKNVAANLDLPSPYLVKRVTIKARILRSRDLEDIITFLVSPRFRNVLAFEILVDRLKIDLETWKMLMNVLMSYEDLYIFKLDSDCVPWLVPKLPETHLELLYPVLLKMKIPVKVPNNFSDHNLIIRSNTTGRRFEPVWNELIQRENPPKGKSLMDFYDNHVFNAEQLQNVILKVMGKWIFKFSFMGSAKASMFKGKNAPMIEFLKSQKFEEEETVYLFVFPMWSYTNDDSGTTVSWARFLNPFVYFFWVTQGYPY
ncbi:hypothetical protein L596_013254 [Steinernema carpocapsae]|uniref:F-box domain-containing protein n=1 Tax=Steinernema carpocapsae TaxID=34508 RepID=A0A4U5P0G3_STECR|nr:hypothetical protein L596_013254 [Steinernema carpocapsae]